MVVRHAPTQPAPSATGAHPRSLYHSCSLKTHTPEVAAITLTWRPPGLKSIGKNGGFFEWAVGS